MRLSAWLVSRGLRPPRQSLASLHAPSTAGWRLTRPGRIEAFNSVDADVVAQVVRTWLDDSLEGWPEGSDRHARVT
jgi:hypothetical protein